MTVRQKIRQRLAYLQKIAIKAREENDQVLMMEMIIRKNECENLMKNL